MVCFYWSALRTEFPAFGGTGLTTKSFRAYDSPLLVEVATLATHLFNLSCQRGLCGQVFPLSRCLTDTYGGFQTSSSTPILVMFYMWSQMTAEYESWPYVRGDENSKEDDLRQSIQEFIYHFILIF